MPKRKQGSASRQTSRSALGGLARGLFITFEGIEGSGKTTQARILAQQLRKRGFSVLLGREPGGPPVSEKIRRILLDPGNREIVPLTELFLYEASRSQHLQQWILPALRKGMVVISDRFADASVAYQGGGRRIDLSLVEQLNRIATLGLSPDLTIVVDYSPVEGLERASHRRRPPPLATASGHRLRRGPEECVDGVPKNAWTGSRRKRRRDRVLGAEQGRLDRIEKEALSFHRRVAKTYRLLAKVHPGRVKLVKGRGSKAEIAREVWGHVEDRLGRHKQGGGRCLPAGQAGRPGR